MITRRSLLAALAALPFIPKAKTGPAAVVEETIAVGPLSKTTRTEFDHAAYALGYARMGYGSTDGVRVAAHPCAVSKVWADGAVVFDSRSAGAALAVKHDAEMAEHLKL